MHPITHAVNKKYSQKRDEEMMRFLGCILISISKSKTVDSRTTSITNRMISQQKKKKATMLMCVKKNKKSMSFYFQFLYFIFINDIL